MYCRAQIEFPSILLPPNISSGSIVDITVASNSQAETASEASFRSLQDRIYQSFGTAAPKAPVLRCRNATQTSVVLEWDPVDLATADLISLSLYRNGQKAGAIPRPLAMHSTKISGLSIDTEYTFHLVLRTTAGIHLSERVTVKTHKMTDLSGVTITTGIMPGAVRDALALAVDRIGAKIVEGVRIDTTHFVTTEGRGLLWEKAVEMNIPVVRPEWVDACEKTGRILGVTKFYLDAMRPGPGTEFGLGSQVENSNSSTFAVNRSSVPPSQQQQQQQDSQHLHQHQRRLSKDLPAVPVEPRENGAKEAEEREFDEKAAMKKGEVGSDGGVSEDGRDGEDEGKAEQKARVPHPDEQKVKLDKDMRIRPVQLEPSRPAAVAADGGLEGEESDMEDEKARNSLPGDGGSFQDVAL